MSVRTQRNSLPLLCLNFKVPRFSDYYFRDDFDDDKRDPLWTDAPHKGTIIESDDVLMLAIANAVHGDFWPGVGDDGPVCHIDSTTQYLTVTTKLNFFTVNDRTRAGLYVTDVITGANGIHFGRVRNSDIPQDGLAVLEMGGVFLAYVAVTTLPIWLRITIEGSGAGSSMVFDYSTDGINWTNLWTQPNETWDKVGLLAFNWADSWNAISAPFEFFQLENLTEQECLAPIDTRGPTVFYDGRIKQMSTLKRAIDDKTGLFQISDLSVTLANEDKHYSQKMASYILKNQEATLYHAWTEERDVDKIEVIKLIVEDHSMKGPDFIIKFKDIMQQYFEKKVPENICTSDDFPWIHPDHEGRCMPEILGNASLLGDHEFPGAVEAVYVNTTGGGGNWWFLASAGAITIPADKVWLSDNPTPLVEGSDYDVVYEAGRTYIKLYADPGDVTVSFNAHGYSVAAWDSTNGYIQNLSYIIEYFLRYIMLLPVSIIDEASFTTLAGYYEAMGVDKNCYLILQDRVDAMEILRQLLFTGGAKGYMALDGKFNVIRKNICNWEITPGGPAHIFEQIELFGPPHRKWNLASAINTVNVEFGLIPWQNLYTGAKSDYRDNRFEKGMEDDIRLERREK